jgi:hypothetical protein
VVGASLNLASDLMAVRVFVARLVTCFFKERNVAIAFDIAHDSRVSIVVPITLVSDCSRSEVNRISIPRAAKSSSNVNTYDILATDTSLDEASPKDNTIDTSTSDEVFDVGTVFQRRVVDSRITIIHPRVLVKILETLGSEIDILLLTRVFQAFVPFLCIFIEQCFAEIL